MTEIDIERLDRSGDIRTIAEEAGATRRQALGRVGAGAGGVAILGGLLSPVELFAASASAKGRYSTTRRSAANDVKIGNFALTLEYLEAAFYKAAHDSGALTDPDISGFAGKLAQHEAAHVKALKTLLGGKAVKAPDVDFGEAITDQTTFLKTAAALEPVGTAAYAGAGPHIHSQKIVKAALSIHSVEANHAAWAASLLKYKGIDTSADPAPNSFNKPIGFAGAVKAVGKTGFVKGDLQPS